MRDLNPEFMKDIFAQNWNPYQLRDNSRHESDLKAQKHKAFTYGECSLRVLGPNIWNALPIDMKNCVSLLHFKKLVHFPFEVVFNLKITIEFALHLKKS